MTYVRRRHQGLVFLAALLVSGAFFAVRAAKPEREVTTRSDEAYAHYQRGMEDYLQFRFDDADSAFGSACALDPDFALAWGRRAMLAQLENRSDLAKSYLDHAFASRAHLREIERLRLELWKERLAGRAESEGRDVLETILRKYPHDFESWFSLHSVELTAGHLERAAFCLNKVIENNPNSILAYNNLGYLYADMGRWEDAMEAFRKYAFVNTDEPNPHDSLGELYERLGRYDEAANAYEKSLSADSTFFYGYAHGARLLARLGRSREAAELLADIPVELERSNGLPFLLGQRFGIEIRAGRYDRAEAIIRIRERGNPMHSHPLAMRCQLAAKRGDLLTARALRDTLVARAKGVDVEGRPVIEADYFALITRVVVAEAEGRYADASTVLTRYMRTNYLDWEMNDWIRARAAENFWQAGACDSALAMVAPILKRNPREPNALFWKAQTLEREGKPAEASPVWQELSVVWVRADEDHPQARVMREHLARVAS